MDVRHESQAAYIFNAIIKAINQFIQNYTDYLVGNNFLHKHLVNMLTLIYEFSEMKINVHAVFDKKNLLSKDVVLLPLIQEHFHAKQTNGDLIEVTRLLKSKVDVLPSEEVKIRDLKLTLLNLLKDYS